MRSVVLSIAVHVVLAAIVVTRVRLHVVDDDPVASNEPRLTEIELYVEPPVVRVAPGVASIAPSRVASKPSSPRGAAAAVVAMPARAIEPSHPVAAAPIATMVPSPHDAADAATISAAPHVATVLPAPRDAAETVTLPTAKETAAPTADPANTFHMRVEPDGTAHVTDRRNFQWGHGGSTGYIAEAVAERWLEEHHEQSNVVDTKMPPLMATVATFDVSDAAMRMAGQDPYAAEKLKILDATRDQRAEIGARHRERQLLDTPALVRASLADIARLPADKRAAAIRELYLDCEDSPSGEVARATIAEYVHTRGLAIDLPPR